MSRNKERSLPGSPQEVMKDKAHRLLFRLRVQCPFPYDRDEVLQSLLPDGLVGSTDYRYSNIRLSTEWGTRTYITIPDLPDDSAFWLKFNSRLPVPHNAAQQFELPPGNPFHDGVCEWHVKATEVQNTIEFAMDKIANFVDWGETLAVVEDEWPELAKFVSYRIPRSHLNSRLVKKRLTYNVTFGEREEIIDALAAATLLPETKCLAWVGWTEIDE